MHELLLIYQRGVHVGMLQAYRTKVSCLGYPAKIAWLCARTITFKSWSSEVSLCKQSPDAIAEGGQHGRQGLHGKALVIHHPRQL